MMPVRRVPVLKGDERRRSMISPQTEHIRAPTHDKPCGWVKDTLGYDQMGVTLVPFSDRCGVKHSRLALGANSPMKPCCSQSSQSGRDDWDVSPGWCRLHACTHSSWSSSRSCSPRGVVFACSSATDGAPDNCQQCRHSTSKGAPPCGPWKQWNLLFLPPGDHF